MKKIIVSLVLFLMGILVNAQDQNYWIVLHNQLFCGSYCNLLRL